MERTPEGVYEGAVNRRDGSPARSVRREVADELFPSLRLLYCLSGALGFAGILLVEVPAGRATASLWLQTGTFALSAGAVWLPLRRGVVAAVVVAGLAAIGFVALLRYGPLGGAALIFVAAAFVGSVFAGRWGVLLVGAAGLAVYALAAGLVVAGVTPSPDPGGYVPERASTWLRAGVSVAVITLALVLLFERFVGALERLAERIAASRLALEASERERERALAALAGAQRLASLGQLAAGAAHDFRNALMVIVTGLGEARRVSGGGPAEELLRDVEGAAWGAEGTARQLVAFGRPGPHEGDLCDPDRVVEGVARTLGRVLPKGISVRAETAPAGLVPVDASILSQAILNLALNARDAMPGGGRLDLRALPDGEGVGIEVVDTGEGMDPETVARAGEPYFTTKGVAGGSGLGLAMVKDVVERAGGRLEIVSRRGAGTAVRLWLPRAGG